MVSVLLFGLVSVVGVVVIRRVIGDEDDFADDDPDEEDDETTSPDPDMTSEDRNSPGGDSNARRVGGADDSHVVGALKSAAVPSQNNMPRKAA